MEVLALKSKNATQSFRKKACAVTASIILSAGLGMPLATTGTLLNNQTVAYAEPSTQEQAEEALTKLNSLEQQMGEAENTYTQAIIDKEEAQKKVQEAQGKIEDCNEKITDLQGKLGNRARSMYRTGSSSILDLILGATSFSEFATNWGLLTTLNENDENLVSESKSLREEVTEQKKTLDEQQKVAEEKESEASSTYAQAQQLVSAQQTIYNNLSEQAKQELEAAKNAQVVSEAAATESYSSNNDSSGSDSGYEDSYSGGGSSYDVPASVDSGTILGRAYANVGKPYVFGAGGPDAFDCSGFVGYCVTGSYGHALGSTGSIMGLSRVSDPQPGDICVNSGHAAIYLGGGQIIHAANPSTGVVITSTSWMGGSFIYVRA